MNKKIRFDGEDVKKKISRAQWEQISKRVRQAGYKFDDGWKCLLCGLRFKNSPCEHSVSENEEIIEKVRQRIQTSS